MYLEDIVAAIRLIERYTAKGRDDFLASSMVQDAVMRQLSIIGEAAARLPTSLKQKYTGIPWKEIVGMRNVLIHDYAETNIRTVWATIEKDLPRLELAVEGMLVKNGWTGEQRAKAA